MQKCKGKEIATCRLAIISPLRKQETIYHLRVALVVPIWPKLFTNVQKYTGGRNGVPCKYQLISLLHIRYWNRPTQDLENKIARPI